MGRITAAHRYKAISSTLAKLLKLPYACPIAKPSLGWATAQHRCQVRCKVNAPFSVRFQGPSSPVALSVHKTEVTGKGVHHHSCVILENLLTLSGPPLLQGILGLLYLPARVLKIKTLEGSKCAWG